MYISMIDCNPLVENKTTTTVTIPEDGELFNRDESLLGLYNMFGGGNPKTTPDGEKIVEGDMILPKKASGLESRKAVPDQSVFWPEGELIYSFHESITPSERAVIEAAMRHWSQHTCIRFRPRGAMDQVWVRFRSDTQGCWSLVGRHIELAGRGQDISIGMGCANLNVVVHEIGHALGFFHEQSRSDRDQYINIVWENVQEGFATQFQKEQDSNYGIPYDLKSTMQYPQWAFSKKIFEKSTIVSLNPAYQRFLSTNYNLSFRDRILANKMYGCSAACGSGGCDNGGYMRPTGGALGSANQCSCDCPPNTSGPNCETKTRSEYYEDLPCGGIIRRPGIIQTPGYPQRSQPGMSCMWDIHAPAGTRVAIKFNGFEFAPRFTKPGTRVINKCFNETVEIRLRNRNIYDGDLYCGNDIPAGTIMRSDGPRATIIITASEKNAIGRGLSAQVKFVRTRPTGLGGEEDEEDVEEQENGTTTSTETPWTTTITEQPDDDLMGSTENPFSTPGPIFTLPPQPPFINTLPPILPPQPPPSIVTTSSLLEEYEKESRKTLPPVIPFYRQ